jgi:hypothetical protein
VKESEFQKLVIDFAHLHRWRVAHFRPSLSRSGRWHTAVQADGTGFPDLVLVRAGRVVFAELKVRPNKPSREQCEWLDSLKTATETYLWYPEDWDTIQEVLGR